MAQPDNLLYSKDHEWVKLDGETATVGITDYAQNSLGDIVYVDVPKVGDSVTANNSFGSVESVKAVSDLYSPVSGTVTAANDVLKTEPDTSYLYNKRGTIWSKMYVQFGGAAKPTRLNVHRYWRNEFDALLSAVQPAAPPPAAEPGTSAEPA